MSWLEQIIVILLIIAAIIGIVVYIRHEQQGQICEGGCPDCPLRQQCKKPQKQ